MALTEHFLGRMVDVRVSGGALLCLRNGLGLVWPVIVMLGPDGRRRQAQGRAGDRRERMDSQDGLPGMLKRGSNSRGSRRSLQIRGGPGSGPETWPCPSADRAGATMEDEGRPIGGATRSARAAEVQTMQQPMAFMGLSGWAGEGWWPGSEEWQGASAADDAAALNGVRARTASVPSNRQANRSQIMSGS